MTDLTVRAVMTADGSGLAGGARDAQAALDNLRGSHTNLSAAAKTVANDTGEVSRGMKEAGLSAYEFDRAMLHLGGTFGYHVREARGAVVAIHELVGGFGLMNAGALAGGAGLAFLLGHTTLAKEGLSALADVVGDAWDGFDRLVSGTNAVARAQAAGIVAAEDWLQKFKNIAAAQETLKAAGTDQSGGLFDQARRAILFGVAGGVMGGDRGPSTQELGAMGRASDELSKKNTAEFMQRFGLLNHGTAQQFGVTPEQMKIDRDIREHYEKMQESMERKADEEQRRADAQAQSDAQRMNVMFNESNNRFTHDFRAKDITPWNTDAEKQFATGNPLGIEANRATAAARINDARQTREEISKIELEGDQRDADEVQKFIDEVHVQNVRRMDDLRKTFDDFGTSAMVNFKNASTAATDFLKRLAAMAIQMQIMQPLGQALFGAAGTGGGGLVGNFAASIFGGGEISPVYVTPSPAGFYHSGGMVGIDGRMRYVHPSHFDGAPRFHGGGVAGDEVPIVAQKGEGIFTPAQMAALGKGMSAGVTVNVHNNSGAQARVQQGTDANGGLQIDVLIDQLDQAMADRTARGNSAMAKQMQSSFNLSRTPY